MQIKKFKISGMSCSHCHNNVKNALLNIQGVETVIVDRITSTVEVSGTFIADEIEASIKKTGFIYERNV